MADDDDGDDDGDDDDDDYDDPCHYPCQPRQSANLTAHSSFINSCSFSFAAVADSQNCYCSAVGTAASSARDHWCSVLAFSTFLALAHSGALSLLACGFGNPDKTQRAVLWWALTKRLHALFAERGPLRRSLHSPCLLQRRLQRKAQIQESLRRC